VPTFCPTIAERQRSLGLSRTSVISSSGCERVVGGICCPKSMSVNAALSVATQSYILNISVATVRNRSFLDSSNCTHSSPRAQIGPGGRPSVPLLPVSSPGWPSPAQRFCRWQVAAANECPVRRRDEGGVPGDGLSERIGVSRRRRVPSRLTQWSKTVSCAWDRSRLFQRLAMVGGASAARPPAFVRKRASREEPLLLLWPRASGIVGGFPRSGRATTDGGSNRSM
jgi:hypothetical protein